MSVKLFVGINYTEGSKNLEFNPETPRQCGAVIARLIEDEIDAINFTFTVMREPNANNSKPPVGTK